MIFVTISRWQPFVRRHYHNKPLVRLFGVENCLNLHNNSWFQFWVRSGFLSNWFDKLVFWNERCLQSCYRQLEITKRFPSKVLFKRVILFCLFYGSECFSMNISQVPIKLKSPFWVYKNLWFESFIIWRVQVSGKLSCGH